MNDNDLRKMTSDEFINEANTTGEVLVGFIRFDAAQPEFIFFSRGLLRCPHIPILKSHIERISLGQPFRCFGPLPGRAWRAILILKPATTAEAKMFEGLFLNEAAEAEEKQSGDCSCHQQESQSSGTEFAGCSANLDATIDGDGVKVTGNINCGVKCHVDVRLSPSNPSAEAECTAGIFKTKFRLTLHGSCVKIEGKACVKRLGGGWNCTGWNDLGQVCA
jgi:hypothetical protein